MATVHIGKKIKEVLFQRPLSIVEFADKINKTRTVVYDIFKRNSIDSLLLSKISKVLDHDFFMYYYLDKPENQKTLKEKEVSYSKKKDQVIVLQMELQESRRQSEELRKQNELLLKLVNLLESGSEKKKN